MNNGYAFPNQSNKKNPSDKAVPRHIPSKRVEIIRLKMIRESSILYSSRVVRIPSDAAGIFRDFIGDCDREVFCILCLNTKNEPTALHQVSSGTLNASLVHPREVFKAAFLNNSASIICAHNHPSGSAVPSPEDIELTQRLRDCGCLLGVEILDHLILGKDDSFISLQEKGLF
jgi:DNA repair protein RadC